MIAFGNKYVVTNHIVAFEIADGKLEIATTAGTITIEVSARNKPRRVTHQATHNGIFDAIEDEWTCELRKLTKDPFADIVVKPIGG